MAKPRAGARALLGMLLILASSGCAGSHMTRTPAERAMWKAAEDGNPEAQRRVAQDLRPDSEPGGARPDVGHAAFWYRTACEQHYANAQIEFYEFAEDIRLRTRNESYLDQALPCLQDAIDQGHRRAIVAGAERAETLERNYERAFYLYALMSKEDPDWADRRWGLVDKLAVDLPNLLERRAAQWRDKNKIKDDDDFLREQSSAK